MFVGRQSTDQNYKEEDEGREDGEEQAAKHFEAAITHEYNCAGKAGQITGQVLGSIGRSLMEPSDPTQNHLR